MKIGDRVFVRGYIDEIRKDTVIIRNAGGYFGTIPSEVITGELPSAQPERKKGEWLPQDHNKRTGYVTTTVYYYPKCSECGHTGNYGMNYCPSCGADMRGKIE